MATLVEDPGAEQHAHHQQDLLRLVEQFLRARDDLLGTAMHGQPDVGEDEGRQGDDHHGWPEQGLEHAGDHGDGAFRHQRDAELQRQQPIPLRRHFRRSAGRGIGDQDSRRTQPFLDEVEHLPGGDAAARLVAEAHRELFVAAASVKPRRDQVEQPRQLHDLTVGAADQVRRFAVTRSLVFADQLGVRHKRGHRAVRDVLVCRRQLGLVRGGGHCDSWSGGPM